MVFQSAENIIIHDHVYRMKASLKKKMHFSFKFFQTLTLIKYYYAKAFCRVNNK